VGEDETNCLGGGGRITLGYIVWKRDGACSELCGWGLGRASGCRTEVINCGLHKMRGIS
jgi:hypothetical protein